MTTTQAERVALGSYAMLVVVSTLLTINLFLAFGGNLVEQSLFTGLALGLEGTKIFLWIKAKTFFSVRKIAKAVVFSSVYAGLAVVSVAASLGWSLGRIEAHDTSAEAITQGIARTQIEELGREIEAKQAQLRGLPPEYVTASQRLSEQIEQLRVRRDETIKGLAEEREEKRKVADIFKLLGSLVGMDSKKMLLGLFLLLTAFVELGMLVLAPTLKEPEKTEESAWERFLNALFAGGNEWLNPILIVSRMTGLSQEECQKKRELLVLNSLVVMEKGGRFRALVKKESILQKVGLLTE